MKMVMHSLLLFWIGLASAVAPVSASEIGLSTRQEGNWLNVEGWLSAPVDKAVAWSVLTDYGSFPEFVPGIHANQVLEAANGVKIVEQRGEVVSGPFHVVYSGRMRVEEHTG